MKKEIVIYHCDVCKKETDFKDIQNHRLPVIIRCSQDDGASCEPFIKFEHLDLCKECLCKATVIEYGFRKIEGFIKTIK